MIKKTSAIPLVAAAMALGAIAAGCGSSPKASPEARRVEILQRIASAIEVKDSSVFYENCDILIEERLAIGVQIAEVNKVLRGGWTKKVDPGPRGPQVGSVWECKEAPCYALVIISDLSGVIVDVRMDPYIF